MTVKRRELRGWTNDPIGDLGVVVIGILFMLLVGVGLIATSILLFMAGKTIDAVWAGLGGVFMAIPGVGGMVWFLRWWVGK